MPLVVRRIEPVSVGRKKLVFSDATNLTENNLVHSKEECANRTLSNILRQLASLGQYKSDNLQYNTLVRWADGTNDSLTKRLTFQVNFFHNFL